jgi:hypothetical protein
MRARRLPVLDEYVEDGESAVFVDGRVLALSPIATAILSALDEMSWRSSTDVGERLEQEFGTPPDGSSTEDATQAGLVELAGWRLVEIDV